MTTASAPNHRASLLSGLRTGGVRSTSLAGIPHTAAPGGSFNVPRLSSQRHSVIFPEEDDDRVSDMLEQNLFANNNSRVPQTAAVDGPNNRFSQHQEGMRGMNPNSVPFVPPQYIMNNVQAPTQVQTQALQMQMMQLEIMRLQTIQAQQYQAELLAQAQRQQQSQSRRGSLQFNPPATAGPLNTSFDLRAATMRRATQAGLFKSQLGAGDEQVPMTAALGGKFGSRTTSIGSNAAMSMFSGEDSNDLVPPPTPNSTTVISGGTSLGNLTSNNVATLSAASATPSKSDSASNWRRGGNNNSVLSGNNRASSISPSVRITPPPGEQRVSPPPAADNSGSPVPIKSRPMPLRFSIAASQPMPAVAIDGANESSVDNDDASSTASSKSAGSGASSPTTPRSSSSNEMPLSPREEAAKKLYEGLGIGRPAPAFAGQGPIAAPSMASYRMASQPLRQPRGPPSGSEELGPMNFASRIRRKAIGGLGMLMGARERREIVEVY